MYTVLRFILKGYSCSLQDSPPLAFEKFLSHILYPLGGRPSPTSPLILWIGTVVTTSWQSMGAQVLPMVFRLTSVWESYMWSCFSPSGNFPSSSYGQYSNGFLKRNRWGSSCCQWIGFWTRSCPWACHHGSAFHGCTSLPSAIKRSTGSCWHCVMVWMHS